jgi:hypothetical protein
MHLIFLRDSARLHARNFLERKSASVPHAQKKIVPLSVRAEQQKQPVHQTAADPASRNDITGQLLSY